MAFGDHGLGKSLSDVFARTPRKESNRGFLEVDIASIIPPAANPRTSIDEKPLAELAASIRHHGILQPIVVMRRDGGFEIISGERRYRAAQLAGITKIPVVIRDADSPQQVAEARLIENIQREDLNPIDLATAYQALIDQHGLTHEDLADRIGKERSSVSNSLRLLMLPRLLQAEVASGALSLGHAKALLGVTDATAQLSLARRAVEEALSVREVERLAREALRSTPAAEVAPTTSHRKPHLRELETNLFQLFGAPVTITEKRGGKGTLSVHFASREHFQRVVETLARVLKQADRNEGAG